MKSPGSAWFPSSQPSSANPRRLAAAQKKLLELAIELQRFDHRLHQLSQVLPIPLDSELMGEDHLPHDLGMHLYSVTTSLREEEISRAIKALYEAAHADEVSLRQTYYGMKGPRPKARAAEAKSMPEP